MMSVKGDYVSNTNVLLDLSDEDREQAIYWHREKLAVAFGLMSWEGGCSIRIVKNSRICEDRYFAMNAISHVFVVGELSEIGPNFTLSEKVSNCSCSDDR